MAPRLLGAVLSVRGVSVRLTEVEAYGGEGEDPGSHAFRGRTPRTASMFGPPGRLYVYFTYGMHWCANIVCGPDGAASAVLLRAGEIVEGIEVARARRVSARRDSELARGPARLTVALGISGAEDGAALDGNGIALALPVAPPTGWASGPRTGVAGPGGEAAAFPWRFWLPGEPSVSPYRPWVAKRRG